MFLDKIKMKFRWNLPFTVLFKVLFPWAKPWRCRPWRCQCSRGPAVWGALQPGPAQGLLCCQAGGGQCTWPAAWPGAPARRPSAQDRRPGQSCYNVDIHWRNDENSWNHSLIDGWNRGPTISKNFNKTISSSFKQSSRLNSLTLVEKYWFISTGW
jgi:hypothetical protein